MLNLCVGNPVGFFCMKLTLTNLCFKNLYCIKLFKGTTSLPRNGFLNIVNARVLNNLGTMMPPEMGSSSPCYPVIAVGPAEPAAVRDISGGSAVSSSINAVY